VAALHTAQAGELDAATLYALLRLRTDVFVVEQACAYAELDGRDTEPGARHCWVDDAGRVVACLRLLAEPDGATRLGRVATARDRRGEGLGARLVDHALGIAERPVVADVQSHLARWYVRFGFTAEGREFDADGIPHRSMRLA
jgi:ElaA protein